MSSFILRFTHDNAAGWTLPNFPHEAIVTAFAKLGKHEVDL